VACITGQKLLQTSKEIQMLDGRLEVTGIEDESCSALGPRFQHGGFITGAAESSNDGW